MKMTNIRKLVLVLVVISLFAVPMLSWAYSSMKDLPAADGKAVWTYITKAKYQSWPLWPGKGELYQGQHPHGAFLTTYVSKDAQKVIKKKKSVFGNGTFVIKENYSPEKKLAAVTVMYKVKGYNPEAGDWFWAKYGADGSIQKEGKVDGCINCHRDKIANDWVFTGSITKMADLPAPDGAEVWEFVSKTNPYSGWPLWPGKGELYKGQHPHGAFLTTYVSPEAKKVVSRRKGEFGVGDFVIKENYSPEKKLAAVTVMYKVNGYNPEAGNWFWAKYGADGSIQKEGKVDGCINCHRDKKDNDWVFTGSIKEKKKKTTGY